MLSEDIDFTFFRFVVHLVQYFSSSKFLIPQLGHIFTIFPFSSNQLSKERNIYRIFEDRMLWCYYEITLFGDPLFSIIPQIPDYDLSVEDMTTSKDHLAYLHQHL